MIKQMRILNLAVLILLLYACQSCRSGTGNEEIDNKGHLNYDLIANKLIERAALKSNENVLLVGSPGRFDPLITLLVEAINKSGAKYLGTISVNDTFPESWQTSFTKDTSGKNKNELRILFEIVDIGIMLPGATPADLPYGVLQEQLERGKGRTIHFHWTGAYDLNGRLLDMNNEKDLFYQRALLETDYGALATHQREFEEAMRNEIVRVTTPAGTDISFSIGKRPVTRQDGDASAEQATQARNLIDREVELPAGAARVAPVEQTVNGTVAFPDAIWAGRMVTGLIMTFHNGKVVEIEATSGKDAVKTELADAGEAGKSFREFALGMNPMLMIPDIGTRWLPYYGYGAGVVRLSLGNNLELGGEVGGDYVRWNFFVDATVTVGDQVWVKDGNLIR